jgi:hypothetical protein
MLCVAFELACLEVCGASQPAIKLKQARSETDEMNLDMQSVLKNEYFEKAIYISLVG